VVLFLAMILAFTGTLGTLAQSNSLILLSVYFLMNLALVLIKLRPGEPKAPFQVPLPVPMLGSLSSIFLIFFVDPKAFVTVAALLLFGFLVHFFAGIRKSA